MMSIRQPLVIEAVGSIEPEGRLVELSIEGEGATQLVYECAPPLVVPLVPKRSLRRLGRVQRLLLAATGRCMETASEAAREESDTAVCVGTALGELGQTTDFLENLFEKDGAEPKPSSFINSVHNSLAAQIAIKFGLHGENHTICQGGQSFAGALWQGSRLLETGRAAAVLVAAGDGLHPYLVQEGAWEDRWRRGAGALLPFAAESGTLPGEGAAALLLRAGEARPGQSRLMGMRLQADLKLEALDGTSELAAVEAVLAEAGFGLKDMDLVMLGANGAAPLAGIYAALREAIEARRGEGAPGFASYKQRCGEFGTSPALGAVLAAQALGLPVPGRRSQAVELVLSYELSPRGARMMTLLGR